MARILKKRPNAKQDSINLNANKSALYIRVSTDLQANEGYSLDAQKDALQAHCEGQKWTVDAEHIYVDAGESAKTTDRPAFQAMMQAAKGGSFGRVVAVKLDRLSRSVIDFLRTVDTLISDNVDLVLLDLQLDTSTPTGEFMLGVFAHMAQLERKMIAERTMSGRRTKATKAGHNGGQTALGYAYDGESFTLTDDAPTVKSIFTAFLEGSTLTAIAKGLNESGARTQRGGQWYPATVKYILRNGFYAGLVQYDGGEVVGVHPAIVEPDTYTAAIDRLMALKPGPQ